MNVFRIAVLVLLQIVLTDICAQAVEWKACANDFMVGSDAQCVQLSVPQNYTQLDDRKIRLEAFRYKATAPKTKGQVWFLEGGPGGSGRLLAKLMQVLSGYYPEYDLIALDHRGVGGSTRLGCDGDNDIGLDWKKYRACYDEISQKWGDGLKDFSTTNAARDLHEMIAAVRRPDIKVFVWSSSYGTYWAQRYLQLYPDEVDGVILDSICTSGKCYLDNYDNWNNKIGLDFLELCDSDPVCSKKIATFGADTKAVCAETFKMVDQETPAGLCGKYFTCESLRHTLAQMLNSWSERILIPPLLYRLNRCNAVDQDIIASFVAARKAPGPDRTMLNSPMLCDLITMSELFSGRTLSDLDKVKNTAFFSEDVSWRFAKLADINFWPAYQDRQYAQKPAETEIPVFMINGATDPQTPLNIAKDAGNIFTADGQQFVTVPYATHGVVVNSPIHPPNWKFGGKMQTCGSLLLGQFLDNPARRLDTSCTEKVYPVEFSSSSENNQIISQKFFNTDDMWDGVLRGVQ